MSIPRSSAVSGSFAGLRKRPRWSWVMNASSCPIIWMEKPPIPAGGWRSSCENMLAAALLAGGETVVHLKGSGLGGRNQELVLAAAEVLDGIPDAALISVGSDGTDGPTDAAGGYADGDTVKELAAKRMDIRAYLDDNDAYHALQAVENLIITGPTGTNVNDVTVGLIWG